MGSLRAVVVYRASELLPRAYRWCERRQYEVASIVPMDCYGEALTLINQGRADLIVAASKDSLDPNRLPRVEIVPEEDDDQTGSSE
jgi:hypothetical protein